MNILFAASEAAPLMKTGGLGDVAQALPEALAKEKGNVVSVFLPYYKKIKQNPNVKVEYLSSFEMDLSWRKQHVGIFRVATRKRKLVTYLIDNEYYFLRDGAYGHGDDGERFAFFSKAVLAAAVHLGMRPDIIHCNDWQTALIPIFLSAFFKDSLPDTRTVFTIHNIEYQGLCDPYFMCDTLGLPDSFTNTLSFGDRCNFLKGAILSAGAVTTVSESYAEELKYPYFAHGLDGIIRDHGFKLFGIENGINTDLFDPAKDKEVKAPFTLLDMTEKKAENKRLLQEETGLPVRPDVPLIGMVTRLVDHKGLGLLAEMLEELSAWDLQLVVLGTGDAMLEAAFREAAARHPDKFSVNLLFDPAFSSRIYAGSDFYLMPSKSEPCGLSQLIAMRYASIPIVHAVGGLKDTVLPYNETTGEGVGFTFGNFDRFDLRDALSRALTLYGRKDEFCRLRENAMKRDSSWEKSAGKYMALYRSLLKK